mmetsp:Transcript_4621/g.6766  ORF Transcript_4621/g.6766 Transcript_4621/m.6766 type:complete len:339 (-) Transcript_4621:138-1154(-)
MKPSISIIWLVSLLVSSSTFFTVDANENVENTDAQIAKNISLKLRNELPIAVDIYFAGDGSSTVEESSALVVTIPANGGEANMNTYPGHNFSYNFGGFTHHIVAPEHNGLVRVLLGGESEIIVKCTTTILGSTETNQPLEIRVVPWWSPHGAARFLELVRMGYYNGAALNRVVPGFLTQFGISRDYDMRTKFRSATIPDDPPLYKEDDNADGNVDVDVDEKRPLTPFVPGMMSYAGHGANSRSTEIFVVMPDTPQGQLDYFGINAWETPFAIVNDVAQTPVAQWHSYGDMPPWGKGPNPTQIYPEDGYHTYLKNEFPEMDYLEECYVVDIDPGIMEEL